MICPANPVRRIHAVLAVTYILVALWLYLEYIGSASAEFVHLRAGGVLRTNPLPLVSFLPFLLTTHETTVIRRLSDWISSKHQPIAGVLSIVGGAVRSLVLWMLVILCMYVPAFRMVPAGESLQSLLVFVLPSAAGPLLVLSGWHCYWWREIQ